MLEGYADHHVVVAIVQALCTRGMDVMTAADRGQQEADDAELLADALANQRVMLTNDTDFLALAAEHAHRGEVFAPIFFWPQQQRGTGEIMRRSFAKQLFIPTAASNGVKPIRITKHAREQCLERGATEIEVRHAIEYGSREPAKYGRELCRYNFSFDQTWQGTYYRIKQVAPVIKEEADEIVVITVYTFFF